MLNTWNPKVWSAYLPPEYSNVSSSMSNLNCEKWINTKGCFLSPHIIVPSSLYKLPQPYGLDGDWKSKHSSPGSAADGNIIYRLFPRSPVELHCVSP